MLPRRKLLTSTVIRRLSSEPNHGLPCGVQGHPPGGELHQVGVRGQAVLRCRSGSRAAACRGSCQCQWRQARHRYLPAPAAVNAPGAVRRASHQNAYRWAAHCGASERRAVSNRFLSCCDLIVLMA